MIWIGAALATCPEGVEPATGETLSGHLNSAERAWLALDTDAFLAALEGAELALGCLEEPLSPELVAQWHQLRGVAAFVAREDERAALSFRAARELDEAVPEWLGPGSPLETLYLQDTSKPAAEAIQADGELQWWVDGNPRGHRPTTGPAVLQQQTGPLWASLELAPGEPLPPWPEPPPRLDRGWLGAAGGALVVTGALAGASAWQHGRYEAELEARTDHEQADLHRQRTNLLLGASGVGLAATGALVVLAF